MKVAAFVLSLLALAGVAGASCVDVQTINSLPVQDTFFLSSTQNFMCQEDANRYVEQFHDFVLQGGYSTPPVPPGLVQTPGAPTLATVSGYYVIEYGSITFPANKYCWVVLDHATTGSLGSYTRVTGTHYLTDCRTSPSDKPGLPAGTVWLERVDTNGAAVVSTLDLRTRVPWGMVHQFTSELNSTDRTVDLAYSQEDGCFYADTGAGWTAFLDSRNWRPVTVTATWDPPSVAAGAGTNQIFTMTGVKPGYRCVASHDQLPAGLPLMYAYSAIADQVIVVLFNANPSVAIDVASGTLSITCWP